MEIPERTAVPVGSHDTAGALDTANDHRPPELYGTPRRRALLSVVILVTVVSVVGLATPDSILKGGLLTVARPYLLATGLDQHWGVFAPNPRADTSDVFARVDMVDGTSDTVSISNAAGIPEYWNYRWRKYGEQMWTQNDDARDREAFAVWVVGREREQGRRPVRVTLLRHTATNLPPGPGPDATPWRDVAFFTAGVATR